MQLYPYYQQLERYVGWTDADARRVQALGALPSACVERLVDDFYAPLEHPPATVRATSDSGLPIDDLKQALRGWLVELFCGRYDEAYVARRWDLGKRHAANGLDRFYTTASLLRLRRGVLIASADGGASNLRAHLECCNALNTLLDLNFALIEHAYQTEYHRRHAAANRLAVVGKLAGSIVDELRGPLAAAKDSVEFLRQTPQAAPAIGRAHLDRLNRQTNLAERVVSALGDFMRLPLADFQPVEIVECLKGSFDSDDLPESVRLQWTLPVARLRVLGDPAQLRIVLSNLIRNAKEAMHTGGVLRVGAAPDGDAVYVTIQYSCACDCQASRPMKTSTATPLARADTRLGIGLGVSILHDIVGRHRGSLTITTEECIGTTATLRLPSYH